MKYLFLLAGFLIVQHSFAQLVINDPNVELRDVPAFHSIKVSGGIDLLLTKGSQQAVAVSDKYSDKTVSIVTKVKDGVLHIYPEGSNLVQRKRSLKAYVSYTILDTIEGTGATDIQFAESVKEDRMSIILSGASNIKAVVNILKLQVSISGASEVNFTGFVQELRLQASGASDLKSYGLVTGTCDAEISGASDVQLTIEELLKVHASGASSLTYKGSPKKVEVNKSGNSDVIHKN